ncbi:hypothetical protein PG999_010267 [Apiospora kogelbergensis]|uniref:Ankyrin repeat-containing protein n=1 Tax=Apiospora kogelbergensis TaxID=1337665 RepID=A0AAW0QFA9_9PEZI
MADPLSIASGVAGLVALADIVFVRLMKYAKSVKHAEKEIRKLAIEVNFLDGTLNSLSRLADALQNGTFDGRFRIYHIQACNDTLQEILAALNKYESSVALRNAMWPFTTRRIEELIQDLSRHKDTITFALSADSMEGMLQLLGQGKAHTAEIITAIKDNTKITSRIHEDMERRKVLDYYLKSNPQSNYDMSCRLRHSGTGLWLTRLPEFQNWLSAPNSKLWLKGIPGAGKTVLAGVVIEEALNRSTESTASAFFFCDYKNENTHKPEIILRALIYQLAIQKEEAYTKLEQHHRIHNSQGGLPKALSIDSLCSVLQQMIKLYDSVFLIVDGIDECGEHAEDVLETLTAIPEATHNVSMALLSRDEDNIRDFLEGICVSIEIAAHKEDVSEYVRAQLADRIRRRRLRLDDPGLKEEILERLVEGAKGMFRWVACQLDHLAVCDSDQQCRDALDTLPPTLDETYLRILQRIPKSKAQMVGLALNCIAHARNPLTIMQLRELLSVPNVGNTLKPTAIIREGSITKYCSSLLRKSTNGSILEFSHFSVLEFLEGSLTERPDLDEFHVSKSRAGILMTIEYLKYLQLDNFKVIPSGTENILTHMAELGEKFPLHRLAATDWIFYVYSHWENPEIVSLAESLFSPARTTMYTTWALAFTFDLGFMDFDPLRDLEMLEIVAHPAFTPLHMAAALSFPEICRHLLSHNLNPNITSPVGNTIQCAVQGLWSFCQPDDNRLDTSDLVESGEFQPHLYFTKSGFEPIRDVLICLQQAGATLQFRCCSPFHGCGIVSVAFNVAEIVDTLFVPTTLLLAGAELIEEDVEAAISYFNLFRNVDFTYGIPESFCVSLLSLIKALDTIVDKSPAHLRLRSLALREATYHQLDFISDPTAIDATLEMYEQAVAVVRAGNVPMLKWILHQPHLEVANFEDEDGNSLLHEVVEALETNSTLEIIELLLEAGCNVGATNDAGEQPLHVWSRSRLKAEDLAVGDRTVQLLTEKGSDCAYQTLKGKNIIHLVAKYPDQLQIILKYQKAESVTVAMESADAKGYTPFSRSLRKQYFQSAAIMTENIEFSPAMVKSPEWPLSLAVRASSEEIFHFLLSSNLGITSYDEQGRSPLHFLTSKATEAFVLRLKTLYPNACKSHGVDGQPIQVYLESCVEHEYCQFWCDPHDLNAILSHLYTKDTPTFSMWEIFGSKLLPAILARPSYDICEEAVTSIGTALLQLGYLDSYESQASKSGLLPLLECVSHATFHLAFPFTRQVMQQTGFWPEFRTSQPAVRLLKQTTCENGSALMEDLLKQGISAHQRVDGRSAMEQFACQPPATLLEAKPIFEILLKYWDKSLINEPGPDGLALIHLPTTASEWMVDLLVEQGANPDLCTNDLGKYPALVHHLFNGRFEYASALLKNGADPCKANPAGWNAICAASYRGSTQCLEQIYHADELEKRVDWKHTCELLYMNSIPLGTVNGLHLAAHGGQVAVLKFYAEHGLLRDFECACDSGLRPLHYAAMTDSLNVLNFLCREGCDPNAKSNDGKTALHVAAQYGHYEAADCLVQAGCTLSLDSAGLSPLFYAYQSNNKGLIKYLQSMDSNSTGDALGTALIPGIASTLPGKAKAKALEDAIRQNNLTLCQKLHKNGFNLNTVLPTCGCCSPLILAITSQRFSIIEWLLDQQVLMSRPSCVGPGHSTTLHLLIRMLARVNPPAKVSVLDTLLSKGLQNYMEYGGMFLGESPGIIRSMLETANIEGLRVLVAHLKQNKRHYAYINGLRTDAFLSVAASEAHKDSVTPLHIAAATVGNLEAIDILLDMGADINTVDSNLDTPLFVALRHCQVNVSEVALHLVAKGAVIECRDNTNRTPLGVAISRGLPLVVQGLLDANAEVTVLDKSDRSLLHFATMAPPRPSSHFGIFAFLVCRGLDVHALDMYGLSAFHIACFVSSFPSLLLNMDTALEDGKPIPWKFMILARHEVFSDFLRLARRKYKQDTLREFINVAPDNAWSPLCTASSTGLLGLMDHLLGIGAQLDSDGCPLGSAMMAACDAGRKSSVIFLTRRGASLSYSGPSGFRSAYIAAQKFPDILQWLLVDRFTDQSKLTATPHDSDGLEDRAENDLPYTWYGPAKAELVITGRMERNPKESSLTYWIRLMAEKKNWRGKVVPTIPGRRTTHPLNLVPQEHVRIHPDGYEVKKGEGVDG